MIYVVRFEVLDYSGEKFITDIFPELWNINFG